MAQLGHNFNLLLSIFVSYLAIDAQGILLEVLSDGPGKYWVGGPHLADHKGPRTCRTVLMNRDLLIGFAASAEHHVFPSLLLIAP